LTRVQPDVVDVYLIRPYRASWRVLTLQRASNTRCPGSWETVHGHIESGERPQQAAVREVQEETGLVIDRLYNVTVQPFYLHMLDLVSLAVVFAAFVQDGAITLGPEHARAEWLPVDAAMKRLTWPRTRASLADAVSLLAGGDAGPVEDVLRVL
jgi:8-oxo-dGTP pyrophosphatase MutT (NUDIX family)